MLVITDEQRRRALAERHCLSPKSKATTATAAAHAVLALHGTDPATVYLSVAARSRGVTIDDIAATLYRGRSLLRLLAMRRTMFVLPLDLAPCALSACTSVIAVQQRKLLLKHLDGVVKGDRARWLRKAEADTLKALSQEGNLSGQQLAARIPALCTELQMAPGKSYSRTGRITSRVLNLMSADGCIVRGQPTGGIGSSRYGWNRMDRWVHDAPPASMDPATARHMLVAHWLERFGPGSLLDIHWWTGLGKTHVKQALSACGAVEVLLDGGATGYLLPEDPLLDAPKSKRRLASWVALLPALDPAPMGWKERHWYLGKHEAALFDRTGNIGPTVWLDGRIVGGWAHTADGKILTQLLEPTKADTKKAIAREANRLQAWLGDERVTPRFRTPLEKKLATTC